MKYGGLAPVVVIISLGSIAGAFLNPKRPAIDVCLTEFVVNRYEEKSPDYTQAVKAYNWRVPIRPAAYAVPLTTQDVRNAVFCGQTTGLKVTAKGGGHSYGSHGLGGEDGHLVIDMRHFNAVVVDSKAHTATIGAGGRLGNIATTLYGEGAQAISHGTCPG
jgi:FAD/FMN-containing dehydrogenase